MVDLPVELAAQVRAEQDANVKDSDYAELLEALGAATTPASDFSAAVYRSCAPRYAKEAELMNGEGSRRFGGRWNPKGIAMVYASLTPEVAMAEALANNRYYGIPVEDAMPRTFVAIDVRLSRVLDLRSALAWNALGIELHDLKHVDWRLEATKGIEPLTQKIGRAAHARRWEGLVVPSAAAEGHNLLVLPEHLGNGSSIRIRHPDRLTPS